MSRYEQGEDNTTRLPMTMRLRGRTQEKLSRPASR